METMGIQIMIISMVLSATIIACAVAGVDLYHALKDEISKS